MNVLVACEESQTVCKAFRFKGHRAFSCDMQPCSGGYPEWHFQVDIRKVLHNKTIKWDLVIAHPPCTYLTNAGVRHLHIYIPPVNGKLAPVSGEERWKAMYEGCDFFNLFTDYSRKHPKVKVCIENPIPHRYARELIGKYTQLVQPWMFGHTETKATCLWLTNLPNLVPTNNVKAEMLLLPKKERSKVHYMSPGPERAKLRSKTYQGIADAMADQWGNL